MSNTSRVTPYVSIVSDALSRIGTGVAAVCAGAAVGAAAVAKWLAEEIPEDRAAVDRLKEELRRERLQRVNGMTHTVENAEPLRLTAVSLHLRDSKSLVRSAEKLGYRVTKPATPMNDESEILLTRATGERLAIERNARECLVIHTAGDHRRVQALVRQHTVDRAMEHLKSKGMTLHTATLPNGEMQILAREQDTGRCGGAARVRTQIHTDGTAWVDVDEVKGNRCEEIVSELASAVGGEVSGMKKKDSYFQLPGEPTRTKVRV